MSTISELRKLIRQQTVGINSTVRNLIGPVPAEVTGVRVLQDATWLDVRVPGTDLLSLDDFYNLFATGTTRVTVERQAANGIVAIPDCGGTNVLLRGLVQLNGTTNIPIEIVTEGGAASFAFYVNGVMSRQGTGERSFSISLDAGDYLLEFLVAASAFAVALPNTLRVVAGRDVLNAPIWASVTPYYVDPTSGVPANLLRWYNSARVGGWSVLRRDLVTLGPIVDIGAADGNGRFAVSIAGTTAVPDGDWLNQLVTGASVFAGFEEMGLVIMATLDPFASNTIDGTLYTGATNLEMRLPVGRTSVNPLWAGRTAGTGHFQEIARIQRSGQGAIVGYDDMAVTLGQPYEYVLQAYGVFDPAALSPYSDIRYVRTGDTEPPGPIVFEPLYPQVINQRMTVRFTTPVDEDYAGVRVFYKDNRDPTDITGATVFTGTASGATSNTLSDTGKTFAFTTSMIGMSVWIIGGTGQGQQRVITAVPDANTIQFDPTNAWFTTPDTTSQYQIFIMRDVITDYGVPNSSDEIHFGTLGYGEYRFASFDHAGNLQGLTEAVVFEYTPEDDNFLGENQPPTLGIRQLRPDEQALYPAPYNDSLNYAIVELLASDPVDGTTGVGIEYARRVAFTGGPTSGTNLITGVSPTAVTVTGAPWTGDITTNYLAGSPQTPLNFTNYIFEVMGGPGDGEFRVIASNVPNQVVLATAWDPAFTPDTTSDYEISWVGNLPADTVGTTLDNPSGTRSRYVAVSKTDTTNWIQVRAYDQDGLYTDPISYNPDFDTIPEISTVDTRLDTLNDIIYVEGSVDDDTQSFQWWLESGEGDDPVFAVPNTTFSDTSTQKAFPLLPPVGVNLAGQSRYGPYFFNFDLADGQHKTLVLRPYSLPNFAGIAGNDFRKELVRPPRTAVLTADKDERGLASAEWIQISFFCTPAPQVLSSGTITSLATAVGTTPNSVTDTAQSWATGQFLRNDTNYTQYYLRVWTDRFLPDLNITRRVEQFVRIADNTADTLILETGWVPDDAGNVAVGWNYEVRDSVTFWCQALTPDGGVFRGTSEPVYVKRNEAATIYLRYFSVRSGVPAEPIHTLPIDSDTLPSFTGLTLDVDGFQLSVTPEGADDDTKSWIAYVRKGAWPGTVASGATEVDISLLDPAFIKFHGLITVAPSFTFAAGPGTWYGAACPVNAKGEVGKCKLDVSEHVDGSGSAAILNNFGARFFDADPNTDGLGVRGAPAYNLIYWGHTTALAAPQTQYTLNLYTYRLDQGPGTQRLLEAGRYPWQDAVAGNPPVGLYSTARADDPDAAGTNDVGQLYSTLGQYLVPLPTPRGRHDAGDPQYTWVYTAVLRDSGTPIGSYSTQVTGYFQPPIPQFGEADPLIQVVNHGACSATPDNKGFYYASTSLTLQVIWPVAPGTENSTDYLFSLYLSEDYGGGNWQSFATPWPNIGNYTFQWYNYVDAGLYDPLDDVHTQYWTIKIDLIRVADGSVIDSRTSNTYSMNIGRCTGGSQL